MDSKDECGSEEIETQECLYWIDIEKQISNYHNSFFRDGVKYGVELVISNYLNGKRLKDFDTEEIKYFPLSYIQNHVCATELLQAWYKIPDEYKSHLHFDLPCDKHYNLDNQTTHVDGPAPKRKNCFYCVASVHSPLEK
jgi:hypothetical protein